MKRSYHQRALPAVIIALALTLVAAACGSDDDPTAEPSPLDTLTPTTDPSGESGSSLQATVSEGLTTGTETTANADDGSDDDTQTGFCPGTGPTAIRFQTGGSSATINVAASANQVDLYTIEVGSDQIMTVTIGSTDAAAQATLMAPNANVESAGFTSRTFSPTRAGVYRICVAAGSAGADYALDVSVIDDNTPTRVDAAWCGDTVNDRGPIRFAAGSFIGTVEGAVIRGERDLYTIDAAAGQDIDLFMVSLEDNAVFDLRSPSGELLIDEVSDFRFPLPEDGVYQICVGSIRGNATYVLDVAIV